MANENKPTPAPSPISPNVIGRKGTTGFTTGVPGTTPTPKATVPASVAVDAGLTERIQNKFKSMNIPLTSTTVDATATAEKYNDAQLITIGKVLKKLNYTVKPTAASVKTLLVTEPELIELATRYPLYTDFVNNLAAQYLPGLDSANETAPNYPTRQIYKYSDDAIGGLVDSAFQEQFGRAATKEEKQAKIASIRKELEIGTVSTTQKVKNPKTGKIENVVTQQQQGLTTEEATKKLEDELKASNPEAYQRNKALQFNSAVQKILAGGM
jgi:IMP dehydrogenase/GMP reductase